MYSHHCTDSRFDKAKTKHDKQQNKKHSENAHISTSMTFKSRKKSLNDTFKIEFNNSWLKHMHTQSMFMFIGVMLM